VTQWLRPVALILLWPLTAAATERALSLEAAVGQALGNAPQLDARAANVDATRSLVVSAGRLPDPELIVGIDDLPINGPDAYSFTRDSFTMRGIGVMQEFPSAAKRRLRHQRAAADADIAEAELMQVRLDIAREVSQAWIRRATAETSLAELRALEPEVELQAAVARAAVSAGRSSSAEGLAAEAAVVQLANRVLRMESEVRNATFELARWIPADAAAQPLALMPSLDQLPTSAAELLATVHEHGPLLLFESRTTAARIDVDLARAERRPDWSAELTFAKRGPAFSDMVSLQVRIGLPLFARYRQDPVVSARHADLRRLQAEREAELRMHTATLRQMLTEWERIGQQLNRYEQDLLPLARERTRTALASFRAGRTDLRLALDAFAQEVDLVIEHAELRNERGRAWAYLRYVSLPQPHR